MGCLHGAQFSREREDGPAISGTVSAARGTRSEDLKLNMVTAVDEVAPRVELKCSHKNKKKKERKGKERKEKKRKCAR